jgi:CBS domain-containing protein
MVGTRQQRNNYETWPWHYQRFGDRRARMHAAGVVETLPTAHLDDDVLPAIRMVLRHALPGIVIADASGAVVCYLSSTDLLRLALPGYLRDEPGLARVLDEEHADRIAAALVGARVGEVVGDCGDRIPVAGPQASVVELAELMARRRCPLVLVEREDGEMLGMVTANRLLDLIVTAAEDPSR